VVKIYVLPVGCPETSSRNYHCTKYRG